MRVLHVVECYGGGVASAVDAYATSTPGVSHHLLRRIRPGDFLEDGESTRFDSVDTMAGDMAASVNQIRTTIQRLKPQVVHAHSSWAGAFLRGPAVGARDYRIVYTPHGYAFERRDIGRAARSAFWLAEALLARRTDVVAACSVREASLAKSLHKHAKVVLVPNVVDQSVLQVTQSLEPDGVVAVGRLTPARDPIFFSAVVEELRRSQPDVRATWIGGGDSAYVDRLTSAGVEVTGWVPRSEVLRRLASAAVYVHPASWDASPMTLLEANALELPMVARSIPTFIGAPVGALGTRPGDVARKVDAILSDPLRAKENRRDWSHHFARNTREEQRHALMAAYSPQAETITQPEPTGSWAGEGEA